MKKQGQVEHARHPPANQSAPRDPHPLRWDQGRDRAEALASTDGAGGCTH